MENEKCKSQEKKKRMKYESSLEFGEKEKDVTSLFRMNERPNINFWPLYYVLCKEFWEVLYECYYVSKLYEIF